jgi:type II secretory pathway predicted ATPase ExeA
MSDYLRFWHLKESIFLRDLPDGSLFQTSNVRSVIPRLLHFAKENYPSVILITGETGIGKTSFLRWLYFHLSADTHDIWYIPLLSLEPQKGWLIKRLARFLGVAEKGPLRLEELLVKTARKLDQLVAEKRRLLVMIDDAHLIAKEEALGDLAAFLNIQSMGARCLSFVVSGVGNLQLQLGQNQSILSKVVMHYQFKSFSLEETLGYLKFRFELAGISNVFSKEAAIEIHHLARGVPGLINLLAENSLFEGYQKKSSRIEINLVKEASRYLTGFSQDLKKAEEPAIITEEETSDFVPIKTNPADSGEALDFPDEQITVVHQPSFHEDQPQHEEKVSPPSSVPITTTGRIQIETNFQSLPDLARGLATEPTRQSPWSWTSEVEQPENLGTITTNEASSGLSMEIPESQELQSSFDSFGSPIPSVFGETRSGWADLSQKSQENPNVEIAPFWGVLGPEESSSSLDARAHGGDLEPVNPVASEDPPKTKGRVEPSVLVEPTDSGDEPSVPVEPRVSVDGASVPVEPTLSVDQPLAPVEPTLSVDQPSVPVEPLVSAEPLVGVASGDSRVSSEDKGPRDSHPAKQNNGKILLPSPSSWVGLLANLAQLEELSFEGSQQKGVSPEVPPDSSSQHPGESQDEAESGGMSPEISALQEPEGHENEKPSDELPSVSTLPNIESTNPWVKSESIIRPPHHEPASQVPKKELKDPPIALSSLFISDSKPSQKEVQIQISRGVI